MRNILIVEDALDMQFIYRRMFEAVETEYKIEMEKDGKKAFKRLKTGSFDLVILDILMEPMDGEEFYRMVRNDPEISGVNILIVSVLPPDRLEDLTKFGKVYCLQKPVTGEQLFAEIDAMLK
ncbi:MAG: response regulator [Candidatus Omnitrophota bacterium]